MCDDLSDEAVQRYYEAKLKMEQEKEEKSRAAMIYSGARWLEQGEKPSRYFVKMNDNRKRQKAISALQSTSDQLVLGNKKIL